MLNLFFLIIIKIYRGKFPRAVSLTVFVRHVDSFFFKRIRIKDNFRKKTHVMNIIIRYVSA